MHQGTWWSREGWTGGSTTAELPPSHSQLISISSLSQEGVFQTPCMACSGFLSEPLPNHEQTGKQMAIIHSTKGGLGGKVLCLSFPMAQVSKKGSESLFTGVRQSLQLARVPWSPTCDWGKTAARKWVWKGGGAWFKMSSLMMCFQEVPVKMYNTGRCLFCLHLSLFPNRSCWMLKSMCWHTW